MYIKGPYQQSEKDKLMERENIFAKYTSYKELISRIHKKLKLDNKNPNLIKKGQRI